MKKLQLFVTNCGDQDIVDFLIKRGVRSDVRRAFGQYIFNQTEVLTHRSVLSYRVKKVLKKNGILWSGDPMDINVARILLSVREVIAGDFEKWTHDRDVPSCDPAPQSKKMRLFEQHALRENAK